MIEFKVMEVEADVHLAHTITATLDDKTIERAIKKVSYLSEIPPTDVRWLLLEELYEEVLPSEDEIEKQCDEIYEMWDGLDGCCKVKDFNMVGDLIDHARALTEEHLPKWLRDHGWKQDPNDEESWFLEK